MSRMQGTGIQLGLDTTRVIRTELLFYNHTIYMNYSAEINKITAIINGGSYCLNGNEAKYVDGL